MLSYAPMVGASPFTRASWPSIQAIATLPVQI
jgi:hypothetical protein